MVGDGRADFGKHEADRFALNVLPVAGILSRGPAGIVSIAAQLNERHSNAPRWAASPVPPNVKAGSVFSGSGATIIAAEMTGRSVHAIELAPAYVDVAIMRWQAFTGDKATLDCEPFAEVGTARKTKPDGPHAHKLNPGLRCGTCCNPYGSFALRTRSGAVGKGRSAKA